VSVLPDAVIGSEGDMVGEVQRALVLDDDVGDDRAR
jgi:hypothetical protein